MAGVFVGLLEKYPRFEAVAFAVVGFAGVKLAIGSWDKLAKEVLSRPEWVTGIDKTQFSLFILGVLILGTIWAMSQRPRIPTAGRLKQLLPLTERVPRFPIEGVEVLGLDEVQARLREPAQ